jgi:hypothetical protein
MWGFKTAQNRQLTTKIYDFFTNNFDQYFLTDQVWPIAVNDKTAHDSYTCKHFANSKPFPTKRLNSDCFVGYQDWCDDKLESKATNSSLPKCPLECRSLDHQDWEYC